MANIIPNPTLAPESVNGETPRIFGASGRELKTMPYELFRAVDQCDQTIRRYGIQMKLICVECLERGFDVPYVNGDNARSGAQFKLVCPHAEWIYRFTK